MTDAYRSYAPAGLEGLLCFELPPGLLSPHTFQWESPSQVINDSTSKPPSQVSSAESCLWADANWETLKTRFKDLLEYLMRKAGAASTLEQAKLEYGPGPPSYYWAETLGHIKNYIVIAHKQEAVFDDASGWNLGIVARLVFFICLDKLGADSAAADTIHLEIRGSNFEPEMLKDWKDNGFKTRHWRADHGDRNKQMGESDKHWADEAWDNICDENYMASFYTICGGPAIKVVEASRSRERPAVPSSVLRLTL